MSGYLTIQTPGLPAEIAGAFRFETTPVYGADGQFDGTVVRAATLTVACSPDVIAVAIAVLEHASRPGGTDLATRAVTRLRAKTAARAGGLADQHVTGQAYAEELAKYPADIIEAACRRWADNSRWWPAWAELKQECDRMAAKRRAEHRALKDAQRRLLTPARVALPAPKRPETQRERLQTAIVLRRQAKDDRTAARFELQLAKIEKREPEGWARDVVASQVAEQAERAAEYQRLADEEAAKAGPAPVTEAERTLAEMAQQRRDRMAAGERGSEAA